MIGSVSSVHRPVVLGADGLVNLLCLSSPSSHHPLDNPFRSFSHLPVSYTPSCRPLR